MLIGNATPYSTERDVLKSPFFCIKKLTTLAVAEAINFPATPSNPEWVATYKTTWFTHNATDAKK